MFFEFYLCVLRKTNIFVIANNSSIRDLVVFI